MRIVVTGRVQGVGFRYFVEQTARGMGVEGEVWNRTDGAVEMFAQHTDRKVIDALEDALRDGPGRVQDVRCDQAADDPEVTGFHIGPTQ